MVFSDSFQLILVFSFLNIHFVLCVNCNFSRSIFISGIPVIFQEELEEKPESGTKTPVILKDEKPPLAPPEYSKSGSLKLTDDSEPYQPPPPVTRTQDNGRQARPKPTPTYRKPPPYVPP